MRRRSESTGRPRLKDGLRVYVYRTLRYGRKTPPLYSIMYRGRVISRRHRVLLKNVEFVVRKAGWQQTLRENRKNVHAFAVGTLCGSRGCFGIDANGRDFGVKLRYDPYAGPFFKSVPRGYPIKGAGGVLLNENGISAAYTW